MEKKCKVMNCLCSEKAQKFVACKLNMLETCGYSVAALFARLWIALIFWKSAATKVVETGSISIFGINVPTITLPYEIQEFTYILFEDEYGLPFPEIMTVLATFAEILLPILLVLGLGSRFAALGLFIMTLVIQLTYTHADDHIVWMMVTAMLFTAGPGRIALDTFVKCKYFGKCAPCKK